MIPRSLAIAIAAMLLAALGMSFYVWRVRGRVAQPEPASYIPPIAPPSAGPMERVTLYVGYDDPGVLLPQMGMIPLPSDRQQRGEELLRALLDVYEAKSSPHVLGPGSEVRNLYLVDPGLAVIDLNSAFADGHRSGVFVEELTVISMVQTLTANIPGITRVKILVNGKERDTLAGHADLSRSYDISSVQELVDDLRSASN